MGWSKRNIEKTKNRNGASTKGRTVVKYITQVGDKGTTGEDAFQVYVSPQAKIFNAGPASQTDTIYVYAFRGTTQLGTCVDASAIANQQTPGLTYTVNDNSTNMTTITVTVSNALTSDGGTLNIPIKYPTDTYDSSTAYDASLWDASLHSFAEAAAHYSWTYVRPTSSSWNLDLTNENASINADASGNIYATAVRPTCTAKLTRGTEDVSTAVYYISTPSSQNVQGLSINSSSGVLTFNDGSANTPFSFSGTSVEITVTAKVNNELKGTKIMTVSKSLAGKDGDGSPAVSYWLDFSADAIKVNKAGTPSPSSITATAYKQLGGDNPQTATECWMKWGYNTTSPSTTTSSYTYTLNSIDASKDYITFQLYKDTSTYLGESETIPILKDGLDGSAGSPGDAGPAGPVIRGPILWNTDLRRRFCSGSGTGAADSSYIDVIYYDPSGGVNYHYYVCQESYTQSNNLHYWSDVYPRYWSQAQGEYDFIATQLLLAQNAKINFLTNNEFYLTDTDANVHGGGRAATTDSSVIFWAGSEEGGTNINAAPFRVTYNGDIYAQSGVFAGYVRMPYTFVSDLEPDELLRNSSYSAIGYKYVTQTIWKGRLSSAPSNPSTGWCYYNTSSNKYFYYYSSSWRQMTDQNEARGYVADEHAYLIADAMSGYYGMGDGGMLVLPEPSSDLNGFTYHILAEPNIATRAGSGENPAISLMTVNQTTAFKVYAYSTIVDTSNTKKLSFYGGHIEITCAPTHGSNNNVVYKWIVTYCTGGVDLYSATSGGGFQRGYSSIAGYSTEGSYMCITKVQADNTMPSSNNKNRDTLYVSRS